MEQSASPSSFETPRGRPSLCELAPLVDAALAQYAVVPAVVESLRYYNNATYRVVAADGQQYVLRVTSNHYSNAELGAEMQWLVAMQADLSVRVPAPVATSDGRLMTTASAPAVPHGRACNLFRWMEGTHLPEERMGAADFARVGAAAARLHARSAAFAPPPKFERPSWDEDRWFHPHVQGTYQRILAHLRQFFSPAEVDRFDRLVERARSRMRELRSDPLGYGLIHGDFHAGNYLFHEDHVAFIDFEDLGWGYFAYDVATALFGAIGRADYSTLVDAFTGAYCEDSDALRESLAGDLSIFQALRVVFLTSLVVTRDDLAESKWWQGYVVGKLRHVIDQSRW